MSKSRQGKIEEFFPTEPYPKQNVKKYVPPKFKQSKIRFDIGVCQVCGFECNPASQQCGYCMREVNMYTLGMKRHTTPDYIKDHIIGHETDENN